jgi:4-hydroxy-2-oxoheptanedioate aldolase
MPAAEHFLAGTEAGGGAHLNAWIALPDPLVAETIARTSFDSLTLDFQHGTMTVAGMIAGIAGAMLAGKPCIVRTPLGELGLAARALDAGAAGIVCPMVNSVADARAFVDAVKFPPVGGRSWGPHRALVASGLSRQAFLHRANARTFAFAMIETAAAIDNLEAILGTPGIDGVYIGPNDLCVSLTGGADVDPALPEAVAAIDRVAEAAKRHGRIAGIFANTTALARDYAGRGFSFISLGNDLAFLRDRAEAVAAAARGESAPLDERPAF